MAGLKFFLPRSFVPQLQPTAGLSVMALPLLYCLSCSAVAALPNNVPTTVNLVAVAPVPASITNLLSKIDRAANSRQLTALAENFAPSYTVDGMSRSEWQQKISGLWQRYPNLRYQTTIQSWKPDSNGFLVDTLTQVEGSQIQGGKKSSIFAKIQSRQRISNGKITQQQILSEQVKSTSGNKPPSVELTLPEKVRTGEDYSIDAIVQEPLNDDVMMGALSEQSVSGSNYGKATAYKLELLSTGGLYKNTKAPNKAGDIWLSAIFVRSDGMTIVTRRIHVLRRS
jgi:hypothetical protein